MTSAQTTNPARLSRVGISKVERLMNLVIALLSTRTYISAERIRDTVYGYSDSASDEAFSRINYGEHRAKTSSKETGSPL